MIYSIGNILIGKLLQFSRKWLKNCLHWLDLHENYDIMWWIWYLRFDFARCTFQFLVRSITIFLVVSFHKRCTINIFVVRHNNPYRNLGKEIYLDFPFPAHSFDMKITIFEYSRTCICPKGTFAHSFAIVYNIHLL